MTKQSYICKEVHFMSMTSVWCSSYVLTQQTRRNIANGGQNSHNTVTLASWSEWRLHRLDFFLNYFSFILFFFSCLFLPISRQFCSPREFVPSFLQSPRKHFHMFIQVLLFFRTPAGLSLKWRTCQILASNTACILLRGFLLWTVFNLLLTGLLYRSLYGCKAKSICLQSVNPPLRSASLFMNGFLPLFANGGCLSPRPPKKDCVLPIITSPCP